MSTATVHFSHSSAVFKISILRTEGSGDGTAWGASAVLGPHCGPRVTLAAKFSGRCNALSSEWTGSNSRITLRTAPGSVASNSRKFVVECRGPTGGLIHLRPVSRTRRANPVVLAPRRYSIIPSRISDTRLAYGYYLGPAYGYGGGFGSSSILLLIVLGFIAIQAFQSLTSGGGSLTRSREQVSVLKLQVGLLGFARTLQNDLERIADRADTSTSRGLHYVLTETVLALLRQPDMCILGTSSSEVKRSVEAGERRFNQLSLEERGKFDEETLVNVDGQRKRSQVKVRGDGFSNEYIVVTLLVAAEGDYNLPAIFDNKDLKESLKLLGSIPADNIQAVEILWTPQDKGDSLTERDLLRNYPLLKSL